MAALSGSFSGCVSGDWFCLSGLSDPGSNPLPCSVLVSPSSKMMSSGLGALGMNSSPGHSWLKMERAW